MKGQGFLSNRILSVGSKWSLPKSRTSVRFHFERPVVVKTTPTKSRGGGGGGGGENAGGYQSMGDDEM